MNYVTNCRNAKLFIVFIDFSKACDKVPRNELLKAMKNLGCGLAMLCAMAVVYSDTKFVLGAALITATIGVRQGSPTSCLLFTLYVNRLIRELKSKCPHDGFLGWLHSLMLMDDTAILATSRSACQEKIEVALDFCVTSGMVINEGKTKFMVINGSSEDLKPFHVDGRTIENCTSYTYLGSHFTQDGKLKSSIKSHCNAKASQVLKFYSYITKNCDNPFWAKRMVLDAALLSSVFYSCEAWLCKSLEEPQRMYMSAIKTLLRVSRTKTK
jgi:hypothetical protein